MQAAVDYANRTVSRAEAIKKFAIVSGEFTEAGGQLTPTFKVRAASSRSSTRLRSPHSTTSAAAPDARRQWPRKASG